jgi:hypothetical protein
LRPIKKGEIRMSDRIFVHNDPDESWFSILSYTGRDIEMLAGLDSAEDWFESSDVDNEPGFFIIEATYYARFICTSDAHEWDCDFLLDDVRQPDNWEWDDIVMFGTPLWPVTVSEEDFERAVRGNDAPENATLSLTIT